MNIVFLDTDTLGEVESLKQFSEYGKVTSYGFTNSKDTVERISSTEVVFTNKVVIDKVVMDSCSHLQFIGILATGTNNVDLAYAKTKGIEVRNVSGYSTESVAQHTFSMMLALIHNTNHYTRYVKSDYPDSPIFTNLSKPYFELKGKTIGIIGLGNIGRRVASLSGTFGLNIQYYSTSGKNTTDDYKQVDLDELLKTSDIVSIHAPLNDKTFHLIGKEELLKMKKSAYLLNNGRGGIVVEEDLAQALHEGTIAGAGLDVFEKEPLKKGNSLLSCSDNLILSPHIAWASIEARNELVRLSLENLKAFINQ